jgi:hypothetical protein
VCEPRGTIVVKGKGEIEVWYLVAPIADSNRQTADLSESPAPPL